MFALNIFEVCIVCIIMYALTVARKQVSVLSIYLFVYLRVFVNLITNKNSVGKGIPWEKSSGITGNLETAYSKWKHRNNLIPCI